MGRRVRRCAQSLRHDTAGLDWTSDGSSIVFSSSRSGSKNLWRVSVSGGEPELLEVGEQGQTPTLSRVGKRLSYATGNSNVNIWRVGGPSARDEEKMATLLIASRWWDNLPQYSPDGRRVAFGSNRSGFQEVWICDSDGSNRRCCTARSKSLTSLCRLQSHPAQYVSGIPSAAILLSISHPIRCSTRCLANVRARISGPMIAL